MTFKESQDYAMPFGQYKGHTLDDIAADDAGLKYLAWIRDEVTCSNLTAHAIVVYLSDPAINAELEALT